MQIISLLSFALIVLALIVCVVAVCFLAMLAFVIGLALRSTRLEWLSPFVIWVPGLAAAFAVIFTAISAYVFLNSRTGPDSWLEFFLIFLAGELLCVGAGSVIALCSNRRRSTVSQKLA